MTYRILAALELYLGDPRAVDHLAAAIKENPNDALVWVLRARARLMLPDFRDAREALDDAKYADRLSGETNPLAKRMRAMALLALAEERNENGTPGQNPDAYERARREAHRELELGDRPAVIHLLLAAAEAGSS